MPPSPPPLPPSSPLTVLVVDEEPAIRRFLRAALQAQGWACVEAPTAGEGLWAVRHHKPDLILLDLGLPDRDGQALIPEIRALTDAPLLNLSVRDAEAAKVRALDAGADDYVTKPFGVPELLARLRVALRHRIQAKGGRLRVEAGPLSIDLAYRRVTRDGEEVRLPPKEWSILERLATHAGKVVTHAHLLREVWGRAGEPEQQALRVHVRSLRRKLEPDPDRPRYLVTEPGVGYRLLGEG